jgi:hypothetical protein
LRRKGHRKVGLSFFGLIKLVRATWPYFRRILSRGGPDAGARVMNSVAVPYEKLHQTYRKPILRKRDLRSISTEKFVRDILSSGIKKVERSRIILFGIEKTTTIGPADKI